MSISKLKLLADEDVDARLVKMLAAKGVDIVFAPKGIKETLLLTFIEKFTAEMEGKTFVLREGVFDIAD